MGEKTFIPRFRPDSRSALYGRDRPRPAISPILSLPAARLNLSVYGRKDPYPPISPRLPLCTLWAKPPPTRHFAQTNEICVRIQSDVFWGRRNFTITSDLKVPEYRLVTKTGFGDILS